MKNGKLVADIIIETLESAGVKHCYGVVGDTLNLIARSLEKSEIEWVSVRHEEAGAFATCLRGEKAPGESRHLMMTSAASMSEIG